MQINIPTEKKQEIIEAFCLAYKRPEKVFNDKGKEIDNPETKLAFMKRKIREYVQEIHKCYKIESSKVTGQKVIEDSNNFTKDITVT